MAEPVARMIGQILATCSTADPANQAHLFLETMRRLHLTLNAVGSNEKNLRIAAILVPEEDKLHSTTVLLNETGLSRSTLLRRLASFTRRGLIVQVNQEMHASYRATPAGAKLVRDLICEAGDVVIGQQIGFSSELRRRLERHGFPVRPAARTLVFPKLPHLPKMDT